MFNDNVDTRCARGEVVGDSSLLCHLTLYTATVTSSNSNLKA